MSQRSAPGQNGNAIDREAAIQGFRDPGVTDFVNRCIEQLFFGKRLITSSKSYTTCTRRRPSSKSAGKISLAGIFSGAATTSLRIRREATVAASLQTASISAPLKPGVKHARALALTFAANGLLREWTAKMASRPALFGALSSHCVDLINKNDARNILSRLLEQIAHPSRSNTDEHLDKVGSGNRHKSRCGLAGNSLR